ncbi:MAG: cohesin domain-containing protein [Bacteroidota bacterium]
MRYLIVLFSLTLFWSCQGQEKSPVVNTAEVNMSNPLREDLDASKKASTNQALNLRMGEATTKKGETVCLPVVAQNFKNLIGLQYTIQWDSTALSFESVRQFGLPGYGPSNFGDRFADRGYLSTLWTEAGLKGITLEDGATLFELCLTNNAPKGTETEVRFNNGPTTFEVIAADMNQWKFRYANGKVISQ